MWPCTYTSAGQGKWRCIGAFLPLSVGEGAKRNEVQGKRNEVCKVNNLSLVILTREGDGFSLLSRWLILLICPYSSSNQSLCLNSSKCCVNQSLFLTSSNELFCWRYTLSGLSFSKYSPGHLRSWIQYSIGWDGWRRVWSLVPTSLNSWYLCNRSGCNTGNDQMV